MKRYRITLEERTFDVQVLDDPRRAQVRVEVDGETFTVGVESLPVLTGVTAQEGVAAPTPSRLPTSAETSAASMTGGTVTAPLPGVIKSIAVRQGQRVAANDELLVIEAMKMDNVIRAPRAGTTGTIYVAEGRQVAYGESLLELTNGP